MRSDRILISGMGAICAAGGSLQPILSAFRSNTRNIGPVTKFQSDLTYPVFEVKDEWISQMSSNLHGQRTLALAITALDEALAESSWDPDELRSRRVGVCVGTTVACQLNDIDFYREFRSSGRPPMDAVNRYLTGNLAEAIALRLGLRGPAVTVVNACSSGTDSIGVAMSWLNAGLCDVAIAGGADEINKVPYCGFGSLSVTAAGPCAPFDRDRAGLNLGEGAGLLVLERESVLRDRGRRSDLCLAGYGTAGDAHHLTAPHPEGAWLEVAINDALRQAGITPGEIGFVNAHGTATKDNDRVEGAVLARVFGANANVVGTKGFTGHTLGAAGGLEAVFTAAGLREGWIPATAGFQNRDDEIPLAPVSALTNVQAQYAASTSLAFGGNNSAIVIGRLAN